jgi:hypothetical protein
MDFGQYHSEYHMSLIAPERVYAQYRDKPKAYRWYQVARTISAEIQAAADDIRLMYDIDLNSGAQLDIIGRIVGTDRSSITNVESTVVEFGDDSMEFGDPETQFSTGSISTDTQLSDDYFRAVLKSKIQKNNSDTTIDDIIEAVNAILINDSIVKIIDNEDMSFAIEIYGSITSIEVYLILNKGLIPKPQGVRIAGYLFASLQDCCGDDFSCGDQYAECLGFVE